MTGGAARIPPTAAALRKRRSRERQADGTFVCRILATAEIIEALERAGFAGLSGIETKSEAEAAIKRQLSYFVNVTRDTQTD